MEHTYQGLRNIQRNDWNDLYIKGTIVTVDGFPLLHTAESKRHSREFEWGYGGSGPAALAHALLTCEFKAEFGQEAAEEFAQKIYQDFKAEVIAGFDNSIKEPGVITQWELTSAKIRAWINFKYAALLAEWRSGLAYVEEVNNGE